MADLVKENLEKAQEKQKHWYDQGARVRQFEVGDPVLVLLPTTTDKLLAQWQGPYLVVKREGMQGDIKLTCTTAGKGGECSMSTC